MPISNSKTWPFIYLYLKGFPGGAVVKNLSANEGDAKDACSIPGSGSSPREGNDNPHQYSCLENSMDRGAWRATIFVVTESTKTEHAYAHIYPQDLKLQGLKLPFLPSRESEIIAQTAAPAFKEPVH